MKKKTYKNKNKKIQRNNSKKNKKQKYKNKNKKMPCNNSKKNKKYGGKVTGNEILTKIRSLGFEFETGNMIPVILYDDNSTTPPTQKYGVDPEESHNIGTIKLDNEPVNVMIVSSTDTPLSSGGKYSLLSNLELVMKSENYRQLDDLYEFIKEHIVLYNDHNKYNFYNHTEYIFTFLSSEPNTSINDDNIILKYFKYVVDYLKNNFTLTKTITNTNTNKEVTNTKIGSKLNIFNNNSLLYLIPMKSNEDFTPTTIKWVPQMTINIKVIDVISVLEYLTIGLVEDSINNVKYCKDFALKIIGRKTGPIVDILKNVCFMLAYICLRSCDGTTGTLERDFSKNRFDFLFRCSLARIIISLYEKYETRNINICLSEIKSGLEKYIIEMERKKRNNERMTEFEKFYAIFTCISFINFIKLITTNDIIEDKIKKINESSGSDKEEAYQNLYTTLKKYSQRELIPEELTPEELTNEIDPLYLSTNTFFTEIFSEESNYYPYDVENESFLIEYRSFSQNLLHESGIDEDEDEDEGLDVYRDLNIWSSAIDAIENSGTQGHSKKRRL